MKYLEFSNKLITYETFLNDIASMVVRMLRNEVNDPEYVSQRAAFRIFGRRNVERWRKLAKISPIKRPGKLEYKTSELRYLQRTTQDYLRP